MKTLLLYITLVCLLSCSQNSAYVTMNAELLRIKNISKYPAVIIIPSQGCGGCITTAESFMLSYHQKFKNGRILFIVTGHSSEKSAIVRFGRFVINTSYIHVDIEHRFDRYPFANAYPILLHLKDGNVTNVEEIKPESSEKIYNQLNHFI